MSHAAVRFWLVGLVALALAACSLGDDPAERVSSADEATRAAGTARTEMFVTVDTDEREAQLVLEARGAVDFAAEQASMELQVPGVSEPLRTVVDGEITYTRLPESVSDDAGWVRREGPGGGLGLGPGVGVASEHPTRMLTAVSAAADQAEELGSDEIHGTDVDGFDVTVRGADLAGDDDVPSAFAELAIPVQAWLDADDRVHQLVATFDLATVMEAAAGDGGGDQPGAGLGDGPVREGTLRLVFELSDFGVQTDIRVPADDEVIDAEAFEQLFDGREGSGPVPPS